MSRDKPWPNTCVTHLASENLYPRPISSISSRPSAEPFRGETITAIAIQHITTMPSAPDLVNPDIPPALSKVILRCLAKDPAARFSSASALTAAVAEALNVPIPADMRAALSAEDATD